MKAVDSEVPGYAKSRKSAIPRILQQQGGRGGDMQRTVATVFKTHEDSIEQHFASEHWAMEINKQK